MSGYSGQKKHLCAGGKHPAVDNRFCEEYERMRIMLDADTHAVILFNSDFEVVECNRAAVLVMGFDNKAEMQSGFHKRIAESIPPFQSNGKPSIPLSDRLKSAVK